MKIQDIAYVLHRRPYRETSFLVDFFTQHHGIVTAVCRGIRKSKQSLALEVFYPFWIEYGHRHNLASLYQWELMEPRPSQLLGKKLYCGLYINELLIRLLGHHDPYPEIFELYRQTLQRLSQDDSSEEALRLFEFHVLKESGYEIPLEREAHTELPITNEKWYYYSPGVGFTAANSALSSSSLPVFYGENLVAMSQSNFTEQKTLKEAKRLIRITLAALLEKHQPLKSRALFVR
jgi:DNA repair protein RecO (recombination protein O)